METTGIVDSLAEPCGRVVRLPLPITQDGHRLLYGQSVVICDAHSNWLGLLGVPTIFTQMRSASSSYSDVCCFHIVRAYRNVLRVLLQFAFVGNDNRIQILQYPCLVKPEGWQM